MRESKTKVVFCSPLKELLEKFIEEKRACGYRYRTESEALGRLDRFLCENRLKSMELPRAVVERWTAKRPNEQPRTHAARINMTQQFTRYLRQQGLDAYVPQTMSINRLDFTPYIFRREEVKKILEASDHLPPCHQAPMRHLIMPEVFRLLYGCGMRVNEVLRLKVADVELTSGIVTVRDGKWRKDRLVPLAPSMVERLKRYVIAVGKREPDALFFPAPDGGCYSKNTIYGIFRRLLDECGIPHGGRGKGPRLHDMRHAFAIHRLENWYRQGADLGVKLPLLATYMGHRSLLGTQRYLRITPAIFPDITQRMDAAVGYIIPRRRTQ